MLKHKDLKKLLQTLNIPVAYNFFPSNKNVNPPFIVYREQEKDTFKADNITFIGFNNFEIELITDKKDVELEETIETLLTENKIPFDRYEDEWDEEEKIYHIYFEI